MTALDRELDMHRSALQGCRRCVLGDDVRPIVSLARSPRVMLVGQAPGRTESCGGKPFAGRAGKTLWAWLARAGIDEPTARERMYIAAVTRCYPGSSPSGRGDRVPAPRERANCASWLVEELRLIKPRLIIPVGRLAIDEVLGKVSLESVVGREFRLSASTLTRLLEPSSDAWVVPLPHPSGASSWIHGAGHRELLDSALRRIAERWRDVHERRRAA